MSTTAVRSEAAPRDARVGTVDLKLEVITIPVSDVDRAKEFYGVSAGGLDADFTRPPTTWSSSRRPDPRARFTSARTSRPPRRDPLKACC